METQLIPFGKYKGQPLEILAQDPQYLEWIQSQGWLAEKYPQINTLIINNFQEPSETPDHNKIQGMFLDDEFCLKLAKTFRTKKELTKGQNKAIDVFCKSNCSFEVNGIDVIIDILGNEQEVEYYSDFKKQTYMDYNSSRFVVEIKPSIGDDYPAVLRQIRSLKGYSQSNNNILLIDNYCGKGITEEQFIKLFLTQGIVVIFINEII